MGEELSPGPGTAVLVVPMPGGMETPTDTVAAMIAWLFRHGGPRTGEVLTRLERHSWTLELPYPGAVAQTELWASARFPGRRAGPSRSPAVSGTRQRPDALDARRPARRRYVARGSRAVGHRPVTWRTTAEATRGRTSSRSGRQSSKKPPTTCHRRCRLLSGADLSARERWPRSSPSARKQPPTAAGA